MKIVHCCLACFYIDDFGYQENILPKMHHLDGHDVSIIASTETYVGHVNKGFVSPGAYVNSDGIPVTRLAYARGLPRRLATKLRLYRGVYAALRRFSPDIIFLHDCQFLSIKAVVRYVKRNPHVRVYVDGHTDLGNSAKTWFSRHVSHGLIYRYCAKAIEPITAKFYGVLPVRVEFFREVYGIAESKLDLLVLGADDTRAQLHRRTETRLDMRNALGIGPSDVVLISGGKIDERKNIHLLMEAVREIDRPEIKLIVFGEPDRDMSASITRLAEHSSIRYVGWLSPDETYKYLVASDLAIFPGTHSVLWEQAVGVGLPSLFRHWPGMQHVDLGGNCIFLNDGSVREMRDTVLELLSDPARLESMRSVAIQRGVPAFSYARIARKAIEQEHVT